jgi:hypothetical protein
LRRELVAYKDIGLINYVRYITNKDNKPFNATLGSPLRVTDRPENVDGDPGVDGRDGKDLDGDGDLDVVYRDIESEFIGPVRSNTNLTFYGRNRLFLDPRRGDGLEVNGRIGLNRIASDAPNPAALDPAADPVAARVILQNVLQPQVTTPNLFPSESAVFNTYNGLVRDNAPGEDVNGVPRGLARLVPPAIDAPIGPNGLTRYRALTRDSGALAPRYAQANPVGVNTDFAGAIGWGAGMYINNRGDVQRPSTVLSNTKSLRSDWLYNRETGSAEGRSYWRGDFLYVPPAVTITLTPRYMIITRSPYTRDNQGPFFFRRPDNGAPLRGAETMIRYTGVAGSPAPTAGIATGITRFEGYPAEPPASASEPYVGDNFVIFAEGNVRIKGVVGGVDPETRARFLRHLTVVSNATIYIDGNLLRDNITPEMATGDTVLRDMKGRSSIALLAKDYVTVNTTQFVQPLSTDVDRRNEREDDVSPITRILGVNQPEYPFALTLGPVDLVDGAGRIVSNNPPPYAAPTPPAGVSPVSLFLRHSGTFSGSEETYINLLVNFNSNGDRNFFDFNPATPEPEITRAVPANYFVDEVLTLNPNQLFPLNEPPYPSLIPPFATPAVLGLDNLLSLRYDLNPPVTDTGATPGSNYRITRLGAAPLDVRIEAFIYAQDGSFFIIPGPWFNPDPNDTYASYLAAELTPVSGAPRRKNRRADEDDDPTTPQRIDPRMPFHREPMDMRLTIYGTIAENLPAQIGDQGAWLENGAGCRATMVPPGARHRRRRGNGRAADGPRAEHAARRHDVPRQRADLPVRRPGRVALRPGRQRQHRPERGRPPDPDPGRPLRPDAADRAAAAGGAGPAVPGREPRPLSRRRPTARDGANPSPRRGRNGRRAGP